MRKKYVLGVIITIFSVLLCACNINISRNLGNIVEETSEKTFNAAGKKGIEVSVPVGNIRVSPWDKNEIYIKVTKINSGIGDREEMQNDLKDIEIVYKEEGDKLSVKAFLPKFKNNGLSVNLEISAPQSIRAFDIKAEVGDVRLSGFNGKIDVINNVGKIDVDGCDGEINLMAATGDVTVRNSSLKGDSSIISNFGRVLFDGKIDSQGNFKMTTEVGEVNITLPSDTPFDIDASTNAGKINCKFNVSGEINTTKISGKVNGGGPKLTVINNVGSVSINSR